MLDMPIRAGRKLQDAAVFLREGFTRHTSERQQVNSLHRQRMTCSGSLQFTNTQDWTGGMEMSPSGRFRVIEEAKPKQKFFSKEGVRWDAAWVAIVVLVLLCAAILLADLAGMGIGSRSINRLDLKIADQSKRNDELKQELAASSGDVSVCTEAVKLNLISGYGARTIQLTVPQEMSMGAVTADVRGAATWMTGSIGD
jgi:cell division protein FtsL